MSEKEKAKEKTKEKVTAGETTELKLLKDLTPGSEFTRGEERYRLVGITKKKAAVVLLEAYKVQYLPGKYKTAYQGVSRTFLQSDTPVMPV